MVSEGGISHGRHVRHLATAVLLISHPAHGFLGAGPALSVFRRPPAHALTAERCMPSPLFRSLRRHDKLSGHKQSIGNHIRTTRATHLHSSSHNENWQHRQRRWRSPSFLIPLFTKRVERNAVGGRKSLTGLDSSSAAAGDADEFSNARPAGERRTKRTAKTAATSPSQGREAKVMEKRQASKEEGPPSWAPSWAVNMHPALQAAASVGLYFFHMLYLSKSGLTFPFQLIPNDHGLFQSVGLDTAAGFAILGVAGWSRLRSKLPIFPPLRAERVPWKVNAARLKKKLPVTFTVLIVAYLLSGLGSSLCEYILYGLGYVGVDMSIAMHRSIQVLMSHLVWVYMGVRIIKLALKPFFDRKKGSWVGMKWKSNWIWWVVGGYFVSSSLFNMADLVNQFVCPMPPDTESVVVKIINPENNDVAAMAVGSIAPCITAPWWEEVLYRGFLLPALTVYLPLQAAVPSGAILFAVHHMNLQAMLPLSVLGLVWSLLYIYSKNLLVTVLIHAMWNSRVFLGSLLGL